MGLRIGWFSTGRDTAAGQLLQVVVKAVESGELPLEIAFVFSNREEGEGVESDSFLRLVKTYGLRPVTFSSRCFEPGLRRRGLGGDDEALALWRDRYHTEVLKRIDSFEVAFSFLAGYMLVVSAEMCLRHTMLNLHPALPGGPKGTWQEVIWQLIGQKAGEAGAMIHLVTPELDEGPPVAYCRFPLTSPEFDALWAELAWRRQHESLAQIIRSDGETNPLFQMIRRHEFAREVPLILATLQKLAHGAVKVANGRVFLSGTPSPGVDVSAEVEGLLTSVY
ncbi:MAG: formyltransferase family protein [Bacillota bacterium]